MAAAALPLAAAAVWLAQGRAEAPEATATPATLGITGGPGARQATAARPSTASTEAGGDRAIAPPMPAPSTSAAVPERPGASAQPAPSNPPVVSIAKLEAEPAPSTADGAGRTPGGPLPSNVEKPGARGKQALSARPRTPVAAKTRAQKPVSPAKSSGSKPAATPSPPQSVPQKPLPPPEPPASAAPAAEDDAFAQPF